MDISTQTVTTSVPRINTAYRDYIEFTREPFDVDGFAITLQDGQSYDLTIEGYSVFFKRVGIVIPPLVIDVLFNFNHVRWFPGEERMEPM